MTTATMYKTNKNLYSVWQQTQVSYFKEVMKNIKIDFFKAGKIFAELSDDLNRLPSFEEFERGYNEKNN
jgi:hypothetical protein